jgi:histo-blood group ABO system transferase
MSIKTALVVIATGEIYWRYAEAVIASACRFFVSHDVFLFTDRPTAFDVKKQIGVPPLRFPDATLMRYHMVSGEREDLSKYENIFYCDADMLFVAPVGEEIFSSGITATEHPGCVGLPGDPETRKSSTAYVERVRTYFCGGFQGGASGPFLHMADVISRNVDADTQNGVLAKWHDESHLNRYLYDNPPTKILTPSYCWPDVKNDYYKNIWRSAGRPVYEPKLLALTKTAEEREVRSQGPK